MIGKKTKIIIIAAAIFFLGSIAWFDFVFLRYNADAFENQLTAAGRNSDVVIIFNSGGWGTVPFDRAADFNPIIYNTQALLESYHYRVSVVPYYRTKESVFARIASLKEIVFGFPDSSKTLGQKINIFLKENPDKKIILAGLSNGAAFVNATMADFKDNSRVMAIEFGAPFSKYDIKADNILSIANSEDVLAQGDVGPLFLAVVRSPFLYASSWISGHPISYTEAVRIKGHSYSWLDVGPQLTSFISQRFD
jgi:hypothetical protein